MAYVALCGLCRGNGYITDPHTGKKYEEGSDELPWENDKI